MASDRRYHLSAAFPLFVVVALLLGLGAMNSQNNLLFLAFGLAVAAILVSGVISGAMLMSVRIEREPVWPVTAGDRVTLRYRIRNRSRLVPAFCLAVSECGDEGGRGSPRLAWRTAAFATHVPAGGSVLVESTAKPDRRGVVHLSSVRIATGFPFGIMRKSVTFEDAAVLLVRPRTRPVHGEVLAPLMMRVSASSETSSRRGRGQEFFGLRDYAAGDSPRMIAWRASARVGSLVTRETTAHRARRFTIDLDLPAPPLDQAARAMAEEAIVVAASVADAALRARIAVGLRVPAADVQLAPSADRRQRARILDALAALELDDLVAAPIAQRAGGAMRVIATGDPSRGGEGVVGPSALHGTSGQRGGGAS